MSPPPILTLRFCRECGRDDRRHNLPDVHANPRRPRSTCPGRPETITYEREDES